MKIRTSFVSNSSSASFCLYGFQTTEETLKDIFNIDEDKDFFNEWDTIKEKSGLGIVNDADGNMWFGKVLAYWANEDNPPEVTSIEGEQLSKAVKSFEEIFGCKSRLFIGCISC